MQHSTRSHKNDRRENMSEWEQTHGPAQLKRPPLKVYLTAQQVAGGSPL